MQRVSDLIAAAAAGILLAVAVLHIGPEAIALSSRAGISIALGLVFGWAVARAASSVAGGAELALLGGVAVHSFADGLILAAAGAAGAQFLISSGSGLLAHEAPEGVLCYLLARRAGLRPLQAAAAAVAAGGGTTLMGAMISAPAIGEMGVGGVGDLLGFSTGLLAYSALSVLLARPVPRPAQRGVAAGAAGLIMSAILLAAPAHDHAHPHRGGMFAGHTHAPARGSPCLYGATTGSAGEKACPDFSKDRPYRRHFAASP